ncbi:MAG TPA: hypothetical protein DHV36_13685 [Desulfobacteraceae bacterium]|nr:hypothetical protein [Desulfobacteraceae bacterium]
MDMAAGQAIALDSSNNTLFTDVFSGIEEVWGTEYNDTIYGSTTSRELGGEGGDDSLVGGENSDFTERFSGGAGNDTMDGGSFDGDSPGNQVNYEEYDGGNGVSVSVNYTYSGGSGTYSSSATDTFGDSDTLKNIDQFYLSDNADQITITIDDQDDGSDMRWYVWGNEGADTITGTAGENVWAMYLDDDGGVSADLSAGTVVDGWGNTDVLSNIEAVSGSSFSDALTGSSDNDGFFGTGSDDTIDGGGGDYDWLSYGWVGYNTSVWKVMIDLDSGQAIGYDGIDAAQFTDSFSNIEIALGTEGDDTILGSSTSRILDGEGGNDSLVGGVNSGFGETLIGGEGDDTLDGGNWEMKNARNYADYSDDSSGIDLFIDYTWSGGSDSYYGEVTDGWGNTDTLDNIDRIIGSDYADNFSIQINDYDGDLTTRFYVWGGDGADTITGTSGERVRVMYNDADGAVDIDLLAGQANDDGFGNIDVLTNINAVGGSDYNDVIAGSTNNEGFFASLGNDTIDGDDGDWDWVVYDSFYDDDSDLQGGVDIDLSAGTAKAYNSSSTLTFTDSLSNIEGAYGSSYNDTITGSSTTRELGGEGGDDYIVGNSQNANSFTEYLNGGEGDDTIDGGNFSDDNSYRANNQIEYDWSDTGAGVDVDIDYTRSGGTSTYTGTAIDPYGDTDTLIDIDRFNLTSYDDSISITVDDQDGDSNIRWYIYSTDGSDDYTGTLGERVRLLYLDDPGNVTVDLSAGTATDGWGNTDSLTTIPQVSGSNDGNDTLIGSSADEGLIGSLGSDSMDGGDGYDWTDYSWISIGDDDFSYVEIDLATNDAKGYDSTSTLIFTDTLENFEEAWGSSGNDYVAGDANDNYIGGNDGNDTLNGGAGGMDTLRGDWNGSGQDTFQIIDSSTYDVIADFSFTDSDIIQIDETQLGFTAYGYNEFTQASSASQVYAMDYQVIAVTDYASSDWSDVSSVLNSSLYYVDAYDQESYFIVSNNEDSRAYYWEGDTNSDSAVSDSELHLGVEMDGIADLGDMTDAHVEIV